MTTANELERYMLELVNEERTSLGLHELELELNLNSAAEDHSTWVLDTNAFSHTGVGGSSPTERIIASGFDYVGTRGTSENIAIQSSRGAEGFLDDVLDLHIALMNSPGHRANILSETRDYIGIGIEIGSFSYSNLTAESVMVTQNFGRTQGTVDLDILEVTGGNTAPPPDTSPEPTVSNEPETATASGVVDNGTDADDVVQGSADDDALSGGTGNDILSGGAGSDVLDGGTGNDVLAGSSGDDVVRGGSGNDNMGGGTGDDVMDGGSGNDTLGGGLGNDSMDGGTGDDGLFGGAGDDTLSGGDGDENMAGSFGADLLGGDLGHDNMGGGAGSDVLNGGAGNDTMGGGEGNDIINGGAGNDFAAGGGRDDTIDGGSGDDRINGGTGSDQLTGGTGKDTFIFNSFTNGERDTITDWTNGEDVLRLTGVTGNGAQQRVDALDITAVTGGVEFDFNGHTVFLQNATVDDLGAEDFMFL